VIWSIPIENHTVAVLVNDLLYLHTSRDITHAGPESSVLPVKLQYLDQTLISVLLNHLKPVIKQTLRILSPAKGQADNAASTRGIKGT
jgi:hypothetical protein